MIIATVDGGKSGLRLRLSFPTGSVDGNGPGFAYGDSRESDRAAIVGAVRAAVADARRASPLAERPADAAFVGLTGVPGDPEDRARLEDELAPVLAERVFVMDDGFLAHAGTLGGPGTVATVGTGTNITTITAGGDVRVHDAWGPLIGDRGSAYAIGLAGVRAAAAALDGAGRKTRISERLDDLFGGHARSLAILQDFTRRPDMVARIAWFANEVLALAGEGDTVASDVQATAARDLAATLDAAALPGLPVTYTGRLLTSHPSYLEAITAACSPDVAMRLRAPRGTGLDAGPVLASALGDQGSAYATILRERANR